MVYSGYGLTFGNAGSWSFPHLMLTIAKITFYAR